MGTVVSYSHNDEVFGYPGYPASLLSSPPCLPGSSSSPLRTTLPWSDTILPPPRRSPFWPCLPRSRGLRPRRHWRRLNDETDRTERKNRDRENKQRLYRVCFTRRFRWPFRFLRPQQVTKSKLL